MRHKDRTPVLAEKNRAAPSVRNLDFAQLGMQIVNPPLDRLEQISRLASGYVDVREIERIVRVHEASAEDHASVAATAAPQVRQIDRVEGIASRKADGFEPLFIHGLSENRERKLRLGAPGKRCESESQCVRGEKDFPGGASCAACVNHGMNDRAALPFDLRDRAAFDDCGAAFVCGSGKPRHEFSGIERSSRNFFQPRARFQNRSIGSASG